MRRPVLAIPFRGTVRQLVVCDDGTAWEAVEKDNKVAWTQHATIPQPAATKPAEK